MSNLACKSIGNRRVRSSSIRVKGRIRRHTDSKLLYDARQIKGMAPNREVGDFLAEKNTIEYIYKKHRGLANVLFTSRQKVARAVFQLIMKNIAAKNGRWEEGHVWWYATYNHMCSLLDCTQSALHSAIELLDSLRLIQVRRRSSDPLDSVYYYAVEVPALVRLMSNGGSRCGVH
jgi:hypothetical protein